MADLKTSVFSCSAAEKPSAELLDEWVNRYGWFAPVRILREIATGVADPLLSVTAPWRNESSLCAEPLDFTALPQVEVSSDVLIDRFLGEKDLRIVAEEGEPEEEVRIEPQLSDDDALVSEELAEIYLAQGFCDQAIAIYRKLSLLNPEKSVYFAELIGKIENNN